MGIAGQGQRHWGALPDEKADAVVVENAIWCGNCLARDVRK